MEPELTDEQLEFLGVETNGTVYWIDKWKFDGSNDVYFYDAPSLSEVLEEIYKAGKEAGAAEKVEEIKSRL